MCLSRGSTLHERWIGYVRTDAPSGQYCSQARMLPAPSWAGAGDRAAGRHQHTGTEDGGNSQGEAQSPQPKSKCGQNLLRSVHRASAHFLKPFGTAICQGGVLSAKFVQFRSTKTWCRFQILPGILQSAGKYVANFAYADNFDCLCVLFRINLGTPTGHAFIQKAQYRRRRRLEDDEFRLLSWPVVGSLDVGHLIPR